MRHAHKLASALLILALVTGLVPALPTGALAADPPVFVLGTQLNNLTGTIEVSYLSADKKTYLVALLLDSPIMVSIAADNGVPQAREVARLALNAAPKNDRKRAKVSGTLVSSASMGVPDPASMPCALDPASVSPFSAAKSVSIGKRITSLNLQNTHQLTFSVKPASAERSVSWESSNPSVLTVDATGKLSAIAKGSATVTARARNGRKAALKLRVTIPTASISLDQTELILKKGKRFALKATVSPEDASNKGVRWTSSDERIAKVSGAGNVTARSPGTAVITATTRDGGHRASCLAIVESKSGSHQPTIALDGQSLALPFSKADAQAALSGWTAQPLVNGFTQLASAKWPDTTIRFDPTGELYWLTSEDPGALVTSQGLSVGSSLKDVIAKGGTPARHSAWPGCERFVYLLPDAKAHGSPLMIDALLEGDTVRRIQIYAAASPYADP